MALGSRVEAFESAPAIHLTEEEIFGMDVSAENVSLDDGDISTEDYFLAQQRDDCDLSASETFLQVLAATEETAQKLEVEVHASQVGHDVLPVSNAREEVDIPVDPAYTGRSMETWPNEGVEQIEAQGCNSRSRHRQAATFPSNAAQPRLEPVARTRRDANRYSVVRRIRRKGINHAAPPEVPANNPDKLETTHHLPTAFPHTFDESIFPKIMMLGGQDPLCTALVPRAPVPEGTAVAPFSAPRMRHDSALMGGSWMDPVQVGASIAPSLHSSMLESPFKSFKLINSQCVMMQGQMSMPPPATHFGSFSGTSHVVHGSAFMTSPMAAPVQFATVEQAPQSWSIEQSALEAAGKSSMPRSAPHFGSFSSTHHVVHDSAFMRGAPTAAWPVQQQYLYMATQHGGLLQSDLEMGRAIGKFFENSSSSSSQVWLSKEDSPTFSDEEAEQAAAALLSCYAHQQAASTALSVHAPELQQALQPQIFEPVKDRHNHNKRPRYRWTKELHNKFAATVAKLGGPKRAKPKSIFQAMACPQLTRNHIKRHLQIFRDSPSNTRNGRTSKRQLEIHQKLMDLARVSQNVENMQRLYFEREAQVAQMLADQRAQAAVFDFNASKLQAQRAAALADASAPHPADSSQICSDLAMIPGYSELNEDNVDLAYTTAQSPGSCR